VHHLCLGGIVCPLLACLTTTSRRFPIICHEAIVPASLCIARFDQRYSTTKLFISDDRADPGCDSQHLIRITGMFYLIWLCIEIYWCILSIRARWFSRFRDRDFRMQQGSFNIITRIGRALASSFRIQACNLKAAVMV
jgi:hypothetical protein